MEDAPSSPRPQRDAAGAASEVLAVASARQEGPSSPIENPTGHPPADEAPAMDLVDATPVIVRNTKGEVVAVAALPAGARAAASAGPAPARHAPVPQHPPSPEVEVEITRVEAIKSDGNAAFGAGLLDQALGFYSQCLELLEQPPLAATPQANLAAILIRNNIAAVHLRQGKYSEACKHCGIAIATSKTYGIQGQPPHTKALFRRGEALVKLGRYSLALRDLETALQAEPNNPSIRAALDECEDLAEGGDEVTTVASDGPSDEGPAAAGGGGAGEEDDNDDAALHGGLRDSDVAFAERCLELATEKLARDGAYPATVYLQHAGVAGGPPTSGMITIAGAFGGAGLLDQAMDFVRGQHVAAAAECIVVVTLKRDISYPLVWWAGHWPFALDCDGLFVEAENRYGRKCSWFAPLRPTGAGAGAGAGAEAAPGLAGGSQLPCDCMLIEAPMFPGDLRGLRG